MAFVLRGTLSVAEPAPRLRRSVPAERDLPSPRRRAVFASTVSVAATAHAFGQLARTRTERFPDALSWKAALATTVGAGVAVGAGVGRAVAAGVTVAVGSAVDGRLGGDGRLGVGVGVAVGVGVTATPAL